MDSLCLQLRLWCSVNRGGGGGGGGLNQNMGLIGTKVSKATDQRNALMLTRDALEDNGGHSNTFSTLFHVRLAITLLWDSNIMLSSFREQNRLYCA